MTRINLMVAMILGCLFLRSSAMNQRVELTPSQADRVIRAYNARNEAEQRLKGAADREAFWDEQFGKNNKFKKLDPRLQRHIAKNFILPRSRAEKARVINKMCLPLVVEGLTPIRIESIESKLCAFYDNFIRQHPKRHANESVRPSVIAYVNINDEIREVNSEPSGRLPVGDERAVLYSNGFIEWWAKDDEHKAIRELSAEKKVLAARLYKEALDAEHNIGVQLGRKRVVDGRYDELFFPNQANPNAFNERAYGNYGNLHTQRVKRHNLGVQLTKIGAALSSVYFCAQIYFGDNGRGGLNALSGKLVNPVIERVIAFGGITYVAGHLLIAMKSLVRTIINY